LDNSLIPVVRTKVDAFKQNKYVQKLVKMNRLLLFVVVLPNIFSVFYFCFFASDVYVSESDFIVKTPTETSSSTSSGLLSMLSSAGGAQPANPGDAYSVQQYILSRDAAQSLIKKLDIKNKYSAKNIDRLSRFTGLYWDSSFEAFYKYYLRRVDVEIDTLSAITTLTVRAYSAQDAYQLNLQLLEMAEQLVNEMNLRGKQDLIDYAAADVARAESIEKKAERALAIYRNANKLLDPVQESTANIQLIGTLRNELIAAEAQLDQVRKFAINNPQIPVLEKNIASLKASIASETNKTAGNQQSLAMHAEQLDRLVLEQTTASTILASATANLEDARSKVLRKALYVERIVQPNQPDIATEPRTLFAIITILILSLFIWGVFELFVATAKEHRS